MLEGYVSTSMLCISDRLAFVVAIIMGHGDSDNGGQTRDNTHPQGVEMRSIEDDAE